MMPRDNKLWQVINLFGVVVAYSWFRLDPFIPCFGCERDLRGLGRSIPSMFPMRGYHIRDVFASTYNITIHDTSINIYSYIKYMELEMFGGNCYFIKQTAKNFLKLLKQVIRSQYIWYYEYQMIIYYKFSVCKIARNWRWIGRKMETCYG